VPVETNASFPATTVISGGTDAPAGGTTETWAVAGSGPFPAAVAGSTQFHVYDPAMPSELIAVTNAAGSTWTVTRGAASTTPVAHASGFTVQQNVTMLPDSAVTAAALAAVAAETARAEAAEAALAASAGIVPPAGDIGGTVTDPVVESIQGTAVSPPPGGTADYLRADGTWAVPSGPGTGGVVPLAFAAGGTTAVSAALGNVFDLTVADSTTTLGNPSQPSDGQVIRFRLTQGPGGGFTLAYGSGYAFGAAGEPVLSTAAGTTDILTFQYDAFLGQWCCLGAAPGFAEGAAPGGAIAPVQSNSGDFRAAAGAVTLRLPATLGNLLVVCLSEGWQSAITPPPRWAQAGPFETVTSNLGCGIFYLAVGASDAGASSFTFSMAAPHSVAWTAREWNASAGWASSPAGPAAGAVSDYTATIATGTTAPTAVAASLAVAALGWVYGGEAESALTSGYTAGQFAAYAGQNAVREAYKILSATGTQSCQETISAEQPAAGVIATFATA